MIRDVPAASGPSDLTITNCSVFDGESADLARGPVVVRDGRVVSIGASGPEQGEQSAADGAVIAPGVVIDAGGGTVLPGLVDAHCHAYGIGLDMMDMEAGPLSYTALLAAERLGAALRRGFTTIRDVAGGDIGLARAIAESRIAAPRYLYTGAALSQTGGHGDARPPHWDICACHGRTVEVVDGTDALRVAVRQRFRQGAHAIKVMTSGGVVSLADPIRIPQYSPEELQAVADEAARRDSYVAAHAYSPEAIIHSVTNGVRSIEHGNLLDTASAEAMAEHGAFLIPTLAAYHAMDIHGERIGMAQVSRDKNREVLDAGKDAIEIALAAGVEVGFGSDLMGELESEQLTGLRLQAEVTGILETLRSATSRNARLIGHPELGRVVEGAPADLLVLPGNPLERPQLVWDPEGNRTVIQAGRIVA